MALVKNIKHQALERETEHTEVECTYAVGDKYLQLDTYGSSSRKMRGKKSQSIRLTSEAIQQLKNIFVQNGL
ncbi:hypothetical protein AGMMS50225_27220 [Betaproteobacteria bacterium]|nr:hypothetical protein AGMMS50225_27220 [Betaproteobacteria bacterium]